MPKARQAPRQAKEVFQVSPWQDRRSHTPSSQPQQQLHSTVFAPLLAQKQPSECAPPCPSVTIVRPEPVTSQWMDRKAGPQQQQQQQQHGLPDEGADLTKGVEEQHAQGTGRAAGLDRCATAGSPLEHQPAAPQVQLGLVAGVEDDDWLQPVPSIVRWRGRPTKEEDKEDEGVHGEGQGEQERLQERQVQQPHAPFRLRLSEAGLSGVCRLAQLPGGHLSGHLLDKRTKRCYGLMGTRVAVGGGGCRHDEDVEFLCMSLLTFGTPPREASAAVVKTGGDMPRMEPAEEGDLARFPDLRLRMRVLPSSSSACDKLVGKTGGGSVPSPSLAPAAEPKAAGPTRKIEGTAERRDVGGAGGLPGAPSMLAVEEGPLDTDLMLEVRMHFVPAVLYDGEEADQHLSAFAPRLRGRGATVSVGTMRIDGLPQNFA